MRLVSMLSIDGNTQKLDGGALFGNVPKAVWSQWIPPDKNNLLTLACRCLLLTLEDERRILLETGIGAFFEPKLKKRYGVVEERHQLLHGLEAQGIDESDIDIVILSHLHFDHAGGLLTAWKENAPLDLLFSRAEYWVGKQQWERACSPHSRDRASYIPRLQKLLQESGRLKLLSTYDTHILSPLIDFSFSDGHTPGLMLSHIHTAHGPLVFCSDLVPGVPWVHEPITMGYDRYPELLINEKSALLTSLLETSGYVFFTHDMQCVVGRVCKSDTNKFYVTEVSLSSLLKK